MPDACDSPHQSLAIEASLQGEAYGFGRERLRLPMGLDASFGWLRHPPTLMVVPRWADGRVLLLRRYRPAVGQRLLEFPSGRLAAGETVAQAAQRLLDRLLGPDGTGAGQPAAAPWEPLGQLRPNPGYSDECMALGLVRLGAQQAPPANDTAEGLLMGDDGSTGQRVSLSPAALDGALASGDEPLDGRTLTAWFLARRRW
ncbi:MAG: NUDIX hydrolase [Cyanobacteria bacterium]|nr:NUDIX hydrolase [Cyanobacteriota bacterium]